MYQKRKRISDLNHSTEPTLWYNQTKQVYLLSIYGYLRIKNRLSGIMSLFLQQIRLKFSKSTHHR